MAGISKLEAAKLLAAQNSEYKKDVENLSLLLKDIDNLPEDAVAIINKYIPSESAV